MYNPVMTPQLEETHGASTISHQKRIYNGRSRFWYDKTIHNDKLIQQSFKDQILDIELFGLKNTFSEISFVVLVKP